MKTYSLKQISRREALAYLGFAGAISALSGVASAGPAEVATRISDITGGTAGDDKLIMLDLPEIAENGNAVKVAFDIDSPMTKDDFVRTVYLLADGNPAPNVAKFSFTTDMGACSATTRMRLSKTQNVYLLAEYNNGKFAMTKSKVKVTIGGCGG